MRRSCSPGSRLAWVMLMLTTGCSGVSATPDWKALYAQKLGQPLVELHEASLNQPFQDGEGNFTRVSWARLADGTTVFLGLPSYHNPSQRVVDDTIVLSQTRLQEACQREVGKQIITWGWSMGTDLVTNQVNVQVSARRIIPDPTEPTCQLTFLPGGWNLRLVYDKGPIEP